ncbi:MAG: Secretion system C-terminal sorting domain, partial [Bacteroidetes bacterium]|nr:Secretion system C-terminal sorting domain [Bacteroidota bacterium]
MKKIVFTFLLFIAMTGFAQVPKKVVAEHFTNTLCSICAARNPGFYTNLANHPSILHLAVHPSSPYAGCTLSQHNVAENNSRTNYYSIFGGTPRIVIQGSVIPSSANYSDPSLFSPFTGQVSPASIKIKQVKYGNDSIRSRVVVKTEANHSLGNLRLFISLAEDTVFFNAPNGENQHHDVFRKSLGGAQGMSVTLPSVIGDSIVVSMSSTVHATWNFSRIFTMAILQEEGNKAMVQAEALYANGNPILTGVKEMNSEGQLIVYPNPTRGKINICLPSYQEGDYKISDVQGSVVKEGRLQPSESIDISSLAKGIYSL